MKKILKTIIPVALLIGGSGVAGLANVAKEAADTELILLKKDEVSNKKFLNEISNITHGSYEIKKTFDGIANGYLINVPASSIAELEGSNLFEYVGANQMVEINTEEESSSVTYDFRQYSAETLNIPADSKKGEGTLIAIIDSSFDVEHEVWKTLGEDVAKKYTESDVTTKMDGSKGIYVNNKIVYAHDYGGTITLTSDGTDIATKVEDNDLIAAIGDDCHGQHTSSMAAGNGDRYQGIAPNAQVALMKISSDVKNQSTYYMLDENIIDALNDAYKLGVDVVNMSIGTDLDEWDTSAYEVVLQKLETIDCETFVSAGNDGRATWNVSGMYSSWSTDIVETGTAGGLTCCQGVNVVAASVLDKDDPDEMTFAVEGTMLSMRDQVKITEGSETNPPVAMPFSDLIPEGELSVALPYVCIPGVGLASDYEGIDVEGKIAVISRGDTTFVEKIAAAKGAGAIGCVIHNNVGLGSLGGFALTGSTVAGLIPTLAASTEVGNTLRNAENKVLIVSRDKLASYSTNGGNASLRIIPTVTTPGSNILGAIYTTGTEVDHTLYANYDGTSMACPNMAGTYAAIVSDLGTKDNVMNRVMSTATPIVQANGAEAAVNRQGAGIANATAAESGLFMVEKTSGVAKAELLNNEDISTGKVKFTTVIHNEKGATGVYDATLNVNCPSLISLEAESYPEYCDQKLQTNNQDRIGQKTFSVTLNGDETQEVEVEFELTSEAKEYLSENFENGVVLDGYFKLESDTLTNLNIPFLGFFGDFDKGPCVEDFDFEKKNDGKLYQSTILNHLCSDTGIALKSANYESTVVYCEGGLNDVNMSDIITNDANIKEKYNAVTTKNVDGVYHIYGGATGVADTLIFQQFVNRTVVDNTITMTNSKGEVVLTDHMFDSLYGTDGNYHLYKSLATISLFGNASHYVAHRAYTIIPLEDYANGSYNFHMEYELLDGSKQTRDYVLEINHNVEVPNMDFSIEDKIVTLKFDAEMAFVKVGDTTIEPTENGGEVSYKFDLSTITLKDNVQIYAQGTNYSVSKGLIGKDGKGILFNSEIQNKYFVTFSESTKDNVVTLSYSLSNSKKIIVKPESSSTVCFVTSALNGKTIASVVNAKGETCDYIAGNGFFVIKGTGQKFTITLEEAIVESSEVEESSIPTSSEEVVESSSVEVISSEITSSEVTSSETTSSTGCGGSIASGLVMICAICTLACLSLYYYKKRA